MRRIKYLIPYIEGGAIFLAAALLFNHIPIASRTPPWPMSPNMTPNKKGNTGIAYSAGLTSWYRGIPYVLTIYWKGAVNSFNSKWVGGFVFGVSRMLTNDGSNL